MQDLMGDQFKPLVEKYLLTAEEKIEKAHRANMHNDFKQLYKIAHTLKSNSASLGAKNVASIAEQIEDLSQTVHAGDDYQTQKRLDALIEELRNAYMRIKPVLINIA